MSEGKKAPWRERFREDFGIDLPISGGGGDRHAPVVVTAATPQQAVDVQAAFLRCLGRGQCVAWRYLAQELIDDPFRGVRVEIERVELTEKEVVTEQANYYFAWQGPAADTALLIPPLPSGHLDPRSSLVLPYELEWLHLDAVTDNEAEQPGLGVSAAYGGVGGKAMLYLYDGGQRVDSADPVRIEEEFRRAVGDALRIMEGASIGGAWQMPDDAALAKWRLAILELPDGRLSAVVLGVAQGVFIKGRVTWDATEETLEEMGHACVRAITERVGPVRTRIESEAR